MGLLKKMSGYSLPEESKTDASQPSASYLFSQKEKVNVEEKRIIAQRAVRFVEPNKTIGIGPGTTCLEFAKCLTQLQFPLSVVTNSTRVLATLSDAPNTHLIVTGGELYRSAYALVGTLLDAALKEILIDTLFLGANALDIKEGLTAPWVQICDSIKSMRKICRKTVMLADYSKFVGIHSYRICEISELDVIITDDKADQGYMEEIRKLGVEIIVAKEQGNK
jgi:DeoR/GlpR family transcriptional regulator of sugar metabolism